MSRAQGINISRRRLRGIHCVYCGDPANTDEHFPPQTVGAQGYVFPACLECNTMLSAAYPYHLGKRVAYLKRKLGIKYRTWLGVNKWDFHELKTLGPTMRRRVTSWKKTNEWITARIAWNAESYLRSIAEPSDFVAQSALSTITISSEKA